MCGRSIEQEPPLKDGPHTPICGQGDWLASSRGRLSHLQLVCAHKNPGLKAVRLRHDHCTHSATFDFLRGPDRSSSMRLQAQRRPVPIWYFSCAVSITCNDSYPPNCAHSHYLTFTFVRRERRGGFAQLRGCSALRRLSTGKPSSIQCVIANIWLPAAVRGQSEMRRVEKHWVRELGARRVALI